MEHTMKLNPSPFSLIRDGVKTIELRLYDEKRRKIAPRDTIRFCNSENTKDMDKYYSPERQKQFGVVGIRVAVIS